MYRLLSVKSSTLQNVRLLVGQCAPHWELATAQISPNPELLSTVSKKKVLTSVKTRIPASLRHQSTNSSAIVETTAKKKKKSKPKFEKYVELLEVTAKNSTEKKTKVKRLKAKKLQEFIIKTQQQIISKKSKSESQLLAENSKAKTNNATVAFSTNASATGAAGGASLPSEAKTVIGQPVEYQKFNMQIFEDSQMPADIFNEKPLIFVNQDSKQIFDNPEHFQKIINSFNNFREIVEELEHTDQETVSQEIDNQAHFNFPEEKVKGIDAAATIEPYILPPEKAKRKSKKTAATDPKQSPYKSKYYINQHQEHLAREQALFINLDAYLKACVASGMVNRGLNTIFTYRHRSKRQIFFSKFPIDLYNILLHGYAEKGNFNRFNEIFAVLKEDDIKFNHQTFAAVFECLGRASASKENLDQIQNYIAKAADMGFSLNSIIDKSKFQFDQREITLDAIRRVHPDFTPQYTPPILTYNNVLLNRLNDQVAGINNPNQDKSKHRTPIMMSKAGFTAKQLQALAKEQLKIELEGSITIKSIENKEFTNSDFCRKKLDEVYSSWRTQMKEAIDRDLNIIRASIRNTPQGSMIYYAYLKILNTEQYVDILMKEIRMLAEGSETYSPTVPQLYRNLGTKVQHRCQIEQKKENGMLTKVGEIYSAYCEQLEEGTSNDNPRQVWQRLIHEHRNSGPSMDIIEEGWPKPVLFGIGRFLYNILMRDIKIDAFLLRSQGKGNKTNIVPAFYTLFRSHGKMLKEEVKPHPVLARLVRTMLHQTLTFDSNCVPMLCPPQPWSTPHNGGYLINKSDLLRLPHQAIQQWERIKEASPQDLYPSLDSLNQLASIPWKVNTEILDVIIKVFQSGGDSKLDVAQPPSALPPPADIVPTSGELTRLEKAKIIQNKMFHRRKQAEMYSLWCDTLYRLSLANHYRDKVFWLPHNMDFRGRVYPLPPHLNHLGSDLARSILVFEQAKPLGKDGFSWLKLHCINLTGQMKRDTIRERLLYAEQIMDEILDSADNPLTGRMWWSKSDEPWQTLACCMEIAKVHRCPDPAKFLSSFPIHQDGSCNGLQHYAALGRDKAGAVSVNLAPSNTPQDVYSAVASLVEKMRKSEADNGLEVAQKLNGFVRRKVIKQTVMTTVYGVTRYGARLQIARQLKDIEEFPSEWVWPASTYLTTKTFESLREMFTSTKEIQDWFTECSQLISSVCNQNVEWCTPLGLPVVQYYNRDQSRKAPEQGNNISTNIQMDMFEKPNVRKQKNAFPPNFIHSLDSSHMMLTSLYCEREGLTFVSVHDCFWTHACTVPDMNKICREQFVALHSQPILDDLSKFLVSKYSFPESGEKNAEGSLKRNVNRVLRNQPETGDFDLTSVLNSVYFFS